MSHRNFRSLKVWRQSFCCSSILRSLSDQFPSTQKVPQSAQPDFHFDFFVCLFVMITNKGSPWKQIKTVERIVIFFAKDTDLHLKTILIFVFPFSHFVMTTISLLASETAFFAVVLWSCKSIFRSDLILVFSLDVVFLIKTCRFRAGNLGTLNSQQSVELLGPNACKNFFEELTEDKITLHGKCCHF